MRIAPGDSPGVVGGDVSLIETILTRAMLALPWESPRLPARVIARELRARLGTAVVKSDINPILYRERNLFRSPPVWFALDVETRAGSRPASPHRPVPEWRRAVVLPSMRVDLEPDEPSSREWAIPSPNQFVAPPLRHEPYAWQMEALAAWRANDRRGVIEATTGTGKTQVAMRALRDLLEQGQRALIVLPTVVLLRQWMEHVEGDLGIESTSLVGGPFKRQFDPGCPVTLGVVNSIVGFLPSLGNAFDVVIADECHRYGAATFRHALLLEATCRLGFTAILERSDEGVEEVLAPYFDGVCFRYGFRRARTDGVIAPYSVLAIGVDLSEESREAYEQAGEAMAKARRTLIHRFGYAASPQAFMGSLVAGAPPNIAERMAVQRHLASLSERDRILAECAEKLEVAMLLGPAIEVSTRAVVFSHRKGAARELAEHFSRNGVKTLAFDSNMNDRE